MSAATASARDPDDAFIDDLTTHLGPGWTRERVDGGHGHPSYRLTGPDEETLRAWVGLDRLVVRSYAPSSLTVPGRGLRAKMTAALSKGAPRLAAEIERRILAWYRPALAAARAAQAELDAAAWRREELMRELAVILTPLGEVFRPTHDPGRINAGRYGDPLTVEMRPFDATHRVASSVAVRCEPRLLPRLARALVALAAQA